MVAIAVMINATRGEHRSDNGRSFFLGGLARDSYQPLARTGGNGHSVSVMLPRWAGPVGGIILTACVFGCNAIIGNGTGIFLLDSGTTSVSKMTQIYNNTIANNTDGISAINSLSSPAQATIANLPCCTRTRFRPALGMSLWRGPARPSDRAVR